MPLLQVKLPCPQGYWNMLMCCRLQSAALAVLRSTLGDTVQLIHTARVQLTAPAPDFAGWLVEPRLHVKLPLLLEVLVGDDIVVLRHGGQACIQ
jgi:hypothetical protein